jgi:DNA-binding beta-propeller fold protein YncE
MSAMRLWMQMTSLALALALLLAGTGRASAGELLFVTSLSGQQILTADTGTNVVTPVFSTVGQPDSLIFDPAGNIIYTNLGAGQVRLFNVTTHTDTLIAGGFNDPADLALEPGGGSILVSEFLGGKIDRINLTTHAVSVLANPGGNPQGLAYDSAGRLFANLGTRSGGATSFLARLDPVTGAILGQTVGLVSLDGLTFDHSRGNCTILRSMATGSIRSTR